MALPLNVDIIKQSVVTLNPAKESIEYSIIVNDQSFVYFKLLNS